MGGASGAVTVVVADDEPHVIEYLSAVLHLEGLVLVGTANDADSAVREVTQLQPDVVLLDLHMPGGGLQAAQLIGSLAPSTRIVVFSADADEPEVLSLLESGIQGYVMKGAPPDRIGEAIRAAVDGQAYLAPAVSQMALGALTSRLDAEQRAALRSRRAREQVEDVITHRRFRPVAQPIVELATGRPVAVEALTRFTTATSRSPLEWFLHADEVGLRVALELAVTRTALAELSLLPEPLVMAVNVSPTTILSGRLGEVLIDQPLHRVVLELTEQVRVDDYGRLHRAVTPWRERGARLAVDDVGTGYASFTHVLRLQPDLIKLDRDLVSDIHIDEPRQALARALIGYAAEVGVDVVAEGIETEEERATVAALGARFGQGYHLGRPRPLLDQLEALGEGAGLTAPTSDAALDLRVSAAGGAAGIAPAHPADEGPRP